MSNIKSTTPRSFFPNSKQTDAAKKSKTMTGLKQLNTPQRSKELEELTTTDAKVKINDAVRDFSRIKKAVDAAPEIDNSAKIVKLKQQIQSGNYKVDYEALADKILANEY